jgi:hypothetical protein
VSSGLPSLSKYVVNLSGFEQRSIIDDPNRVSNEIYHRVEDQLLAVVKSIAVSECVEKSEIENEIENLINLRHSCISAPIGFVFPIESPNRILFGILFVGGSGFCSSSMVDINSESENNCRNCAWSSVCAQSWIGPWPFNWE